MCCGISNSDKGEEKKKGKRNWTENEALGREEKGGERKDIRSGVNRGWGKG